MKNVRIIASILFLISRAVAVVYFVTALYATLVLAANEVFSGISWVETTAQGRFTIMYPFTKTPFLLGEYTFEFILMMMLGVVGYGTFAWLLSEVFKIFKQEKLFTQNGVQTLTIFYMANFIVPTVVLLISLFFEEYIQYLIVFTLLHGVIGIFAYFMASIFNQGVLLQNDQDLTI
ncbi:DUF2975 domain-containing protein [Pontibacter sp. KCTC 32443]|uniref:DUF2975 domain-containing protein n=1 Tax=Pontibacter TaxID=323449 RepID=UPI00164EA2D9|nr:MULTISPECIES: DUF2975 domain-containing protein [Pontibacter]MBC5773126.1 DUF2975 domain-containing protein [Pontibacter sp. KCTC 32443]